MAAFKNLIDKRFGRWSVIEQSYFKGNAGQTYWLCKCDCGIEKDVLSMTLINGSSQSCGCLNRETITTHGMAGTPEYQAWTHAKHRCYNPGSQGYSDYGGRGIRMCDRWLNSFENFFTDMGYRPNDKYSIERENTEGDYEPNNCIWATWDVQANNRRNNVLVEIDNKTLTKSQAAESLGISPQLMRLRLSKGLSFEEIAVTPTRNYEQRLFTHNGETGNIAFWSEKTGINWDTLRYRLVVANWTMEDALVIKPVYKSQSSFSPKNKY